MEAQLADPELNSNNVRASRNNVIFILLAAIGEGTSAGIAIGQSLGMLPYMCAQAKIGLSPANSNRNELVKFMARSPARFYFKRSYKHKLRKQCCSRLTEPENNKRTAVDV
ncbi:MAG TPA: hypothetical protein VK699_13285 [Terriglobales bacterium]|nr:hypothetical protein [Terriglobales bacterium]